MRQLLPTALLLLSFIFLATPAFSQSDFVAAKVNQKAITNSELLDRYHFVITTSHLKINSESDKKALLDQILEKMVDEQVILQAAKTLNVSTNEAEINEAVEELAAQQNQTLTQVKTFFKKNNLSFANHLEQIESELLWSKIISEALRPRIKVTEIEIKELLEQHKINTEVKRFFLAEILIQKTSNNSEQLAKKIALELKHGANFQSLAKQFSSTLGENNGEIGWISKGDVDAKIYDEISKLEKGGYSEPVLLGDGYHIFKILDVRTEVKISDNDMKAAREMLFGKKLQNLSRSYLMDLRKKAFIEVKL